MNESLIHPIHFTLHLPTRPVDLDPKIDKAGAVGWKVRMWWMDEWMNESRRIVSSFSSTVVVMVVEPGRVFEALLSFCASRLRRWCVVVAGVVAVLFVAEQNVRTVVVTSACLLALCLCLSVSLSSACCRCGFATAAVSCLEEWFCCCFCCSVSLPESFLFPCNSLRCAGVTL